VRLRPSLPACVAILVALSLPAPAAAGSGGGVAAPDGGGTTARSGGSAYGGPVPSSKKPKKKKRAPARRRRAQPQPPPEPPPLPLLPPGDHVFPVAGTYTLGGEDSKFGAPRSGHTHMGHDLSAARGTPVVAPYAGVIDWVRYQRAGAGHYVVLDADDEHDYVFMHLRRGSIPVVAGQRVAAGEQIGEVGNSGRSFGAHLHFEVWTGGWYEKGGAPVDPLPLLEAWAA
jgi:murein DD-endopeptidase MepM/ murein hydrolase activator NlpD